MKIDTIECADVFDFLDSIDNNSIDLAIIDPPYNLGQVAWDKFESPESFLCFTENYLTKVYEKLKETGSLYVFNTPHNCAHILTILEQKLKMRYQNWIVWYKKDGFSAFRTKYANNQEAILYFTKSKNFTFNYDEIREPYLSTARIEAAKKTGILKDGKRWYPNPKGKLCSDVWEYSSVRLTNKNNGRTTKQKHPTPKPEAMIEKMILASSNEGDLILDLFSGTGTTAYVAQKLNRHYIGCENNPEYVEIIKERLLCHSKKI